MVAANVRNCAIAKSTLAVISWSGLKAIDVKERVVATTKEATANPFSKRLCLSINESIAFQSLIRIHLKVVVVYIYNVDCILVYSVYRNNPPRSNVQTAV